MTAHHNTLPTLDVSLNRQFLDSFRWGATADEQSYYRRAGVEEFEICRPDPVQTYLAARQAGTVLADQLVQVEQSEG